jgi:hypothetical protein
MAPVVTTIGNNDSVHCNAVSHIGEVCCGALVQVTMSFLPISSFLPTSLLIFCDVSIDHLCDIRIKYSYCCSVRIDVCIVNNEHLSLLFHTLSSK